MTFWTEGNNGIKKPPTSRCSVAGDIDADPKLPVFRVCETGTSTNLSLIVDTLVTDEEILNFGM